jgi:glycosyltransferase involved in cell wall biosynthesis
MHRARNSFVNPALSTVAIVLPPREAFAPAAAGAIALLAHRLARHPGRFAPLVIAPPHPAPFADVPFAAARPAWFPAPLARRYAGGVARVIAATRPAFIEVHNRPDIAAFLALRFPATPVALFLHNDPAGMRHARDAAARAALGARLAAVVAVSAHIAARWGRGAHILPNCIDLAAIPAAPREKLILFAGRIVADKGADAFVAACAEALPGLPGWRAEMIGADRFGPDSPETPWIAALRPRAEAAGITLRGYLPHAEVLAAMARAAIAIVPSRWPEPFGLTALEAMAAGAALLHAPRGGLPEVAGDVGLPIDPDAPATIAQAIAALAADPARRAALSAAGQARARRFDVTAIAPRLDALRSDVLRAWSCRRSRPI